MNKLSLSTIEGKTLLEISSGETTQSYDLLMVFECPAYFRVKEGKLDPRAKELCFWGSNLF